MRKLKRDFFDKRQNRPSGIRFTGVPPPSTIYKNSKNIERNLCQNRPSGIRFTGVLPSLYYLQKLQKHRTNSVRKLKRDFFEKRQNRPSGIRFTGVLPPSTIYKNPKNIERTQCVN